MPATRLPLEAFGSTYHSAAGSGEPRLRIEATLYNNYAIFKGDLMPTQKAEAEWKGNLVQGSGRLKVGSGAFNGPYSFKSRFEEGQSATNPEELIGAAHAGCFTMALVAQLAPQTDSRPLRQQARNT